MEGHKVLDQSVIDIANKILKPRNSRTHALLERDEPEEAYFGSQRNIYPVGSAQNIIEFYYGDALEVIGQTAKLLQQVYQLA